MNDSKQSQTEGIKKPFSMVQPCFTPLKPARKGDPFWKPSFLGSMTVAPSPMAWMGTPLLHQELESCSLSKCWQKRYQHITLQKSNIALQNHLFQLPIYIYIYICVCVCVCVCVKWWIFQCFAWILGGYLGIEGFPY